MEPFISTSFDGPQHDDVLRINRGYGDPREGNDTAGTASDIGSLSATPTVISDVGIDDDTDVDYFRFTVGASSLVNVTLAPLGFVYTVGLEGGSTESFDSRIQSDLTLAVLNSSAFDRAGHGGAHRPGRRGNGGRFEPRGGAVSGSGYRRFKTRPRCTR